MIIDFQVISHENQRYATVGDYWREADVWHFRVSRMSDYRYHFLVFLHEFTEAMLCHLMGVSMESIDQFDLAYETARDNRVKAPCGCKPTKTSEPGDDSHAPYRRMHKIATMVERAAARLLRISWKKYNAEVARL